MIKFGWDYGFDFTHKLFGMKITKIPQKYTDNMLEFRSYYFLGFTIYAFNNNKLWGIISGYLDNEKWGLENRVDIEYHKELKVNEKILKLETELENERNKYNSLWNSVNNLGGNLRTIEFACERSIEDIKNIYGHMGMTELRQR